MKNTLGYKTKYYLLLTGCLMFLVLCYNLAFKKTIHEIKAIKENTHQFANLQDAPTQLRQLDLKLKNLNGGLFYEDRFTVNGEVLLLEKANSLSKGLNLTITELPHNDIYNKNGLSVKTQTIIIKGSFKELLTFLKCIERDRSLGNICSIDFFSQRESSSGTTSLKMKVFFQTIIQDKTK